MSWTVDSCGKADAHARQSKSSTASRTDARASGRGCCSDINGLAIISRCSEKNCRAVRMNSGQPRKDSSTTSSSRLDDSSMSGDLDSRSGRTKVAPRDSILIVVRPSSPRGEG